MKPTQYEYNALVFREEDLIKDLIADLNATGQNGWRVALRIGHYVVLERPVPSTPPKRASLIDDDEP